MKMSYASPENHEKAAQIAYAMYGHIQDAGLAGLPFTDAVASLVMLAGMLLSGGYPDGAKRDEAAQCIARGALDYAQQFDGMPRMPMGRA